MAERKAINPDADPLKWAKTICKHHAPTSRQSDAMSSVRDAAVVLIVNIIQSSKPSCDRASAIRKIREGVMLANAAIVLEWED